MKLKATILLLIICGCQRYIGYRDTTNLSFISFSIMNYGKATGKLPSNIVDKNGKPLLSWRVALLKYASSAEMELYKKFKLDESWDSPHNRKVAETVSFMYIDPKGPRCTSVSGQSNSTLWIMNPKAPNYTSYLGVMGQNAALRPEPRRYNANDPSNYVAVVVVDKSDIFWTEPRDIPIDRVEKALRWYGNKIIFVSTRGTKEESTDSKPIFEFK